MPAIQAIQDETDVLCEVQCVHPENVALVLENLPDQSYVQKASALLKAVSDPTRLRILSALAITELCVCDLSVVTGVSESAVSHQLRLLREHNLVSHRKVGRVVYYQMADQHVTDLISSALEHAIEI
jgi:ArsR family transcriptional regulator, lead/cadmium/zinc/bismuth-responsive transcriptional repressor